MDILFVFVFIFLTRSEIPLGQEYYGDMVCVFLYHKEPFFQDFATMSEWIK